jgi:COP9 signalosome complex subunit 2
MLMGSDINPFESQETKPYKNDPRIAAMTDLVDAYQRDEIHRYEAILQSNRDLLEDPFISENIDEVTRNMRTKAVQKLIRPYTRFTLAFVAKQLQISVAEVQDIIGFLIVDKKLKAKINQEKGTVEVDSDPDKDRVHAMKEWSTAIQSLWSTVLNESDGFRSEESMLALPSFQTLNLPSVSTGLGPYGQGRIANGLGRGRVGQKRAATRPRAVGST